MITEVHRAILAVLLPSLLLPAGAAAATLHVPADYPTVGAAIAASRNGDRIVVADGVYSGPDNRDLDFSGKHIRLASENGPANCIIDCQGQGRAFYFHNGEPPAVTLEGLTIQNGVVNGRGGAILCEFSGPTIRRCVFRRNTAVTTYHDGGGAIFATDASGLRLEDCTFLENVATPVPLTGGGAVVVAFGGRASFVRCTFARNTAQDGGAILAAGGAQTTIRSCVFEGNTASQSGGGLVNTIGSRVQVEDCQFVRNLAGVEGGGLLCVTDSTINAGDCAFVGNAAGASGGAVTIAMDSSGTLSRCRFFGNASGPQLGGGGALEVRLRSNALVEGSVMSGNLGGGDGGAVVAASDCDLVLRNSTLTNNEAYFLDGHGFGGAVCVLSSHVTTSNCVLHGNHAPEGRAFGLVTPPPGDPIEAVVTASSSLIQDGRAGVFIQDPNNPNYSFVVNWSSSNFDANPSFVDALGPDGIPGTGDENLHLRPGSPCIDAGDPSYVAQPGETDIDGNPRVVDGNGDGIAVIDIGAYEYQPPGRHSPGPSP